MDMDDKEAVGGSGAQPESTLVFLKLDHDQKKRRVAPPSGGGGGGRRSGAGAPSCQAERCAADLMDAKKYHRRHKVCEVHAKAPAVLVAGLRQRFCQQCSRFHELSEFDGAKRSCRRRLAGHNQRRRRSSSGKSPLMLSSSTSTTSAGCTHPGTHLLSAD